MGCAQIEVLRKQNKYRKIDLCIFQNQAFTNQLPKLRLFVAQKSQKDKGGQARSQVPASMELHPSERITADFGQIQTSKNR